MSDDNTAEPLNMALPSGAALAASKQPVQWGAVPPTSDWEPSAPDVLTAAANDLGLSASTMDGIRKWSRGEVALSDDALHRMDDDHVSSGVAELRALWGADFEKNLARVRSYVGAMPGDVSKVFDVMRDGAGRRLANDPAMLQRVLGAANARGHLELSGSVEERIGQIESHMRTNRRAYDRDEALQATYRELLTKRAQR